MHQKKRKLFVLYSIPIWFRKKFNSFSKSNLCNKEKLYLVSYSIPLKRMGALLLTGIVCSITFSVLGSFLGLLGSECLAAASATLELGASSLTDEVAQGSTAYASSTIKTSGNNDIGSYTLSITGPTQLSNGTTKLNGANNKIGSELEYNTWGYSYDEGDKANENKTYKSFTGNAQELAKASATTGNKVTIDSTAKDITFAARFANDAATGEYKATVTISLVASPTTVVYRLTYDANGGNASSVPSTQAETNSNDSHSFNIASTVPTRTGYTFQGWSETSNGAVQYTANGASGTSKTITLQKSSPTKTLYAVWKAITLDTITTMQEMTQAICTNAADGATKTLTDSRDGKSYTIIKHTKDHRCWMQQNLQLDLTSGTVIEGSKNDGAAYSWTVPINSNNQNMSATTQEYATSGTWTSKNSVVMSRKGSGANGNYYTWCAATAGTCAGAASGGAVASASICPRGWKLPTGGGDGTNGTGEFGALLNGVGISATAQPPYGFPYAGYVDYDGLTHSSGSYGSCWSSTVPATNWVFVLSFGGSSGTFYPGTFHSALPVGRSVRCVAAQ